MKGKIFNEETGKWISGGAAQLHTIKKHGGFDMFLGKVISATAEATAKATVKETLNEIEAREEARKTSKPKLKRVK